MRLTLYDAVIIFLYLASTLVIGLVLRRQAQKSKSSYLLGGNTLPWYMLSLSNASGMFDISGTMWLVTITFVYGLKSIWIPWLWPVFNQVFLMIYLSAWLRRSNVTTGAEWITFRFGQGKASSLSHIIVVVFAVVSCIGFLAYGFIGLGKFVEIFLPWELISDYIPFSVPQAYVPHFYGLIFTLFAMFYAVLGGMTSIVWTDVLQFFIMTISAIVIAWLGFDALSNNQLHVPEGWLSPFFGWSLDIDWDPIIEGVNTKIDQDGYELFSIFFTLVLLKGFLVSAAGPAPNYDMQKILATRSPGEAAKMSGFVSLVLLPIRYLMIAGFTVLAIVYFNDMGLSIGGVMDFEQILPAAISRFVPVGLMGLLLAGLLAAFMSTFAGTLNAAQAYLINDVYLKYVDAEPGRTRQSIVNYFVGFLVVAVSVVIGFFAQNVNSILQWIVSGLWGGYIASNVLKWYWWRFNGSGYFYGMIGGLVPALIMPIVLPDLFPEIASDILLLYFFPVLLLISTSACLLGTYLSKPTDEQTLKEFYKRVRPWGFWNPIRNAVLAEDASFKPNKNLAFDMIRIAIGIIWQTALVALPIFLVLRHWIGVGVSAVIVAITMWYLKKYWFNTLSND